MKWIWSTAFDLINVSHIVYLGIEHDNVYAYTRIQDFELFEGQTYDDAQQYLDQLANDLED